MIFTSDYIDGMLNDEFNSVRLVRPNDEFDIEFKESIEYRIKKI